MTRTDQNYASYVADAVGLSVLERYPSSTSCFAPSESSSGIPMMPAFYEPIHVVEICTDRNRMNESFIGPPRVIKDLKTFDAQAMHQRPSALGVPTSLAPPAQDHG